MNILKILFLVFLAGMLQSCSPYSIPRPTEGENSFTAKLNGRKYIAQDVQQFKNTSYGITGYENEKSWRLIFRNSTGTGIYLYLYQITEPGAYLIGKSDGDLNFFQESDDETSVSISDGTGYSTGVAFSTGASESDEFIEITKIEGDSIIIGKFDKITMSDPDNPDEIVYLTEGRFNINLATLNLPDDF